ncbi:MAG: hypothetical protein EPO52_16125 [Herbiconiux sp.]|uniref:hypothetical protein n=1 Tax=Herbiconiux sp. TaxID=1871186 RepID=UPI00120F6C3C|nr:hypothetical protein [Herbiconiux sp.]TAJ46083.1 MAG: hypothetical protein EPO52_16125 [Herbiconiux sp.]
MTGPDLDPQLSASMRRTILAHARTSTGRKHSSRRIITAAGSIALITGVATAAVAIIVAGLPNLGTTPPIASTPPHSATASPTPLAEPTPTPTPTTSATPTGTTPIEPEGPFVNGFDARQAYQACIDATPQEGFAGFDPVPTAAEFTDDSVKAGVDPYTQDSIPESEWSSVATVYVNWPTGSTPVSNIIALCTVSGPPANPTVTFNRTVS